MYACGGQGSYFSPPYRICVSNLGCQVASTLTRWTTCWYRKQGCYEHTHSYWGSCFHFWIYTQKQTCRVIRELFDLLRNYCTVSHRGCAILHSHQKSTRASILHILTSIYFLSLCVLWVLVEVIPSAVLHLCFLRQSLSGTLKFIIWLGWRANELLRLSHVHPPSTGVTGSCQHAQLVHGSYESEVASSCLCGRHFTD